MTNEQADANVFKVLMIDTLKRVGPLKFMELVNDTLRSEADPDSSVPYHEDCFSFHVALNDLLDNVGNGH